MDCLETSEVDKQLILEVDYTTGRIACEIRAPVYQHVCRVWGKSDGDLGIHRDEVLPGLTGGENKRQSQQRRVVSMARLMTHRSGSSKVQVRPGAAYVCVSLKAIHPRSTIDLSS